MKYFNNMIPVDDSFIRPLNVKPDKNDSIDERAYKILCSKELDWIQKNQDAIIKKANKLYVIVQRENTSALLKKRCLDFMMDYGRLLIIAASIFSISGNTSFFPWR